MDGTVRIGEVLVPSSVPVVVLDDEYTILNTTSHWRERAGQEGMNPVGEPLTAYVPAQERQRVTTALSNALAGDSPATLTFPVRDTDGELYQDNYTLLVDAETETLSLLGDACGSQQTPSETSIDSQDRTAQLEHHREQITRLHEVAVELAQCNRADCVYETMVGAAEDILSLDICLADAVVDGRLVVKATSSELSADGYREPTIEDAGMAGTVYERGESALYNPQKHPEANPHDEFRQSLAVPIGEYGVFQATAHEADAFDQTDLELVELLCRHAREALNRIEQEQALRERSQELELLRRIFGRVFRHNVRNELNVILSNAELIGKRTQDESIAECADTMVDSTDRLLSHTENAKLLDRLMKTSDETVILSLPSLVSRAVERCRGEYPGADITVDVADIHVDVHPTISTAIETSIENAIVHNDSDVSVLISTTVDERTVCLCIEDTGSGIPEQELQVINQENETSMKHSTGVGLWLMKWAVEKSGGSLLLHNTDKGACVEMTLLQAHYVSESDMGTSTDTSCSGS